MARTPERPERRLVLLRHAKSAWPDGVPDHDRPLAARGERDAPAVGRWLGQAGYAPDLVVCSTARRAAQTWAGAASGLGSTPPTRFEGRVYGASPAALIEIIRHAPAEAAAEAATLLVVGHEPAMRETTLLLACDAADRTQARLLDRVRLKFPTAAVAVLAFTWEWPLLGPGQARLAGFMTPKDLPG